MARLAFGGLDFAHAGLDGLGASTSTWAAPTFDATVTRSGRGRSGKILTTTASGQAYWEATTSGATNGNGIEYLFRVWVRFPAWPSIGFIVLQPMDTSISSLGGGIGLNTDGTVSFGVNGGTKSAALAINTWHCIEYRVVVYGTTGSSAGQGQWDELRVNGTVVHAFHNTTSQSGRKPTTWRFGVGAGGNVTFPSAFTCYFDDWALNSNTGAADNTYPGNVEECALLLPAADNTIGANWKLGNNTTPSSNAFDSINNVPPTGKDPASAAAGDELRNAVAPTGVAADEFTVNLQSYEEAGVSVGATINTLFALAQIAATGSSGNTKTLGLSLTANPAVTETTAIATAGFGFDVKNFTTGISVAPSVATATRPTAKMRVAAQSATATAVVPAVGLYVAFVPGGGGTLAPLTSTIAAAASTSVALRGSGRLSATIAAQAGVTATPTAQGTAAMQSSIAAVASVTAALSGGGQLSTTIAAHAAMTGVLNRAALASTIAAQSGLTAVLFAQTRVLAVGHGIGSGLFIELTTLHYPGTPARVLAVLQQFDGVEIPIPINDSRTAKVSLSVYDDSVWLPVHDHFGDLEDIAYRLMVRVRYFDKPVFWGAITVPDWQGAEGKVTLNAVDRGLSLQHAYLRYGDQTIDGTLDVAMNGAKGARFPVTTQGLRLLRDAGKNDANETSHGVPDLGIIDGFAAATPVDLNPVPLVPFRRHDEVWRSMQELASHELAPDFELEPIFTVPGAYAKLNCYFPRGTDRTGSVRLYYGFGPDNLADFDATPGGKLITRQTAVTGDGKQQKVVTDWDSAAERGIYGAVDPVEYDSKGGGLGDILALKAKQQIRAYRVPPKFVKVVLKPEAAIGDPLRRYRYGRDFEEGDTVHVEAKKGWMRYIGPARITQVTLRQTDPSTVVPELELVPDLGVGTVEVTDA